MRTRRAVTIAALLLPLSVAGPAATAVPEAKHGSCERFGQSWGAWARGELPPEFGSPGTVMPDLAKNGPSAPGVAGLLHEEMTEELDFIPGTPYCDPHPRHGN